MWNVHMTFVCSEFQIFCRSMVLMLCSLKAGVLLKCVRGYSEYHFNIQKFYKHRVCLFRLDLCTNSDYFIER